jgi:hypothetical protein
MSAEPVTVPLQETKGRVDLHSNTVWRKCSGTGIVVEPAEVVVSSYILQASVVFEGVDGALVLHSLRAAHVVVVREEELFGAMELPTPTRRLFGSVVPAHLERDLLRNVQLYVLNSGHIWRRGRVWWAQSHRITSCH